MSPVRRKSGGKFQRGTASFLPSIKGGPGAAESLLMLRVASTLLLAVFLVASGQTALTLSSNGDTAVIIVQTVVCVALLSAVIYCKQRHRLRVE